MTVEECCDEKYSFLPPALECRRAEGISNEGVSERLTIKQADDLAGQSCALISLIK